MSRRRANHPPFAPSRTFALSAAALGMLALSGFGLGCALLAEVWRGGPIADLLKVTESWMMCVAAVGGAGSGFMAIRDAASKGKTTSQEHRPEHDSGEEDR